MQYIIKPIKYKIFTNNSAMEVAVDKDVSA